jgi:hypothetical protein
VGIKISQISDDYKSNRGGLVPSVALNAEGAFLPGIKSTVFSSSAGIQQNGAQRRSSYLVEQPHDEQVPIRGVARRDHHPRLSVLELERALHLRTGRKCAEAVPPRRNCRQLSGAAPQVNEEHDEHGGGANADPDGDLGSGREIISLRLRYIGIVDRRNGAKFRMDDDK